MLGERIKHPESTKFYEDTQEEQEHRAKRLKKDNPSPVLKEAPNSKWAKNVIPDSDNEVEIGDEQDAVVRRTELETALPPVNTDQEAIDEYETFRASQAPETGADAISGRLNGRKWVKGKSSIYVDAFNLALETVLEEESHLFDEAENGLFGYWRALSYEAQYL
jgi:Fanconi-associated nuclease 1